MHSSHKILISTRSKSKNSLLTGFNRWQLEFGLWEGSRGAPHLRPRRWGQWRIFRVKQDLKTHPQIYQTDAHFELDSYSCILPKVENGHRPIYTVSTPSTHNPTRDWTHTHRHSDRHMGFLLSSQTGPQSSFPPGSFAQLHLSFLSFSIRIFSSPEMHVHICLLFLALFCIASVCPKNFPETGTTCISSASRTAPKVYSGKSLGPLEMKLVKLRSWSSSGTF